MLSSASRGTCNSSHVGATNCRTCAVVVMCGRRSTVGAGRHRRLVSRAIRIEVSQRVGGYAPTLGFALAAVAIPVMMSVDDWRLSIAPWLLAATLTSFAVCCVGLLSVHQPNPKLSIRVGVVLTVLSLLSLASFPLAVGMGGLLGIEEESAGVLASIPLMASAFGFVAMTPGLALTAYGAGAAGVLPKWGVWTLWVEAPLLPLTAIVGGMAEPAVPIGFALIGVGWVLIGAALLKARPEATTLA